VKPSRQFWWGQIGAGLREEAIAFAFLDRPEFPRQGGAHRDRFLRGRDVPVAAGRFVRFPATGGVPWGLGQLGERSVRNPHPPGGLDFRKKRVDSTIFFSCFSPEGSAHPVTPWLFFYYATVGFPCSGPGDPLEPLGASSWGN